jgi:hypothetical protein
VIATRPQRPHAGDTDRWQPSAALGTGNNTAISITSTVNVPYICAIRLICVDTLRRDLPLNTPDFEAAASERTPRDSPPLNRLTALERIRTEVFSMPVSNLVNWR